MAVPTRNMSAKMILTYSSTIEPHRILSGKVRERERERDLVLQ